MPDLEKRIKRHIYGKLQEFLVFVPIGFEDAFVQELALLGITEISSIAMESGKVKFQAKMDIAFEILAKARTINRLLLKIAHFKSSNFLTFQKEIEKIPFELFILPHAPLHIHVHTKESRLYHSTALEERLFQYLETKFAIQKSSEDSQNLYLYMERDKAELWLDLAGEELYKRGFKKHVAEAPLKETLAFSMLVELGIIQKIKSETPFILGDLMAGSGTFSLELFQFAHHFIPTKTRSFALQKTPFYRAARFLSASKIKENFCPHFTIKIADISEKNIEIITHNFNAIPQTNAPNILKEDFFKGCMQNETAQQYLILNPPYGKRLPLNAPKFYQKIAEKISNDYPLAIVGILIPRNDCEKMFFNHLSKDFKIIKEKSTNHGGFGLKFFVISK